MAIFISYAKEDAEFAKSLFLALRSASLDPWMDKPPAPHQAAGLIPGEDWRARLESEIRGADRVIMILSENSIAKVGYVQRELRLALDVMGAMPAGARFALPLLIDGCEPPDLVVGSIRLSDFQWTSLEDVNLETFIQMVANDLALQGGGA